MQPHVTVCSHQLEIIKLSSETCLVICLGISLPTMAILVFSVSFWDVFLATLPIVQLSSQTGEGSYELSTKRWSSWVEWHARLFNKSTSHLCTHNLQEISRNSGSRNILLHPRRSVSLPWVMWWWWIIRQISLKVKYGSQGSSRSAVLSKAVCIAHSIRQMREGLGPQERKRLRLLQV